MTEIVILKIKLTHFQTVNVFLKLDQIQGDP